MAIAGLHVRNRVRKGQVNHPEGRLEAMANPVRLTGRERALVGAVVDGCANREIARRFGMTEQTVKNQLSVLFQKVGVSMINIGALGGSHSLCGKKPPKWGVTQYSSTGRVCRLRRRLVRYSARFCFNR